MQDKTQTNWNLYYWPGFVGRGQFIRLIFIQTNTSWEQPIKTLGVVQGMKSLKSKYPYFRAVPVVQYQGEFISQTPLIARFVAQNVGGGRLMPKDPKQRLQCQDLYLQISDFMQNGLVAWHCIDYSLDYQDQKQATQPAIDVYKNKRLPKWLEFFETRLAANKGSKYYIGDSLSYVDLAVWLILEGNQHTCGGTFQKLRKQGNLKRTDEFRAMFNKNDKWINYIEKRRKEGTWFGTAAPCIW